MGLRKRAQGHRQAAACKGKCEYGRYYWSTPFSFAAMNGYDIVAMAILSHKAIDVDQKGHYGSTLLSIAVRNCLTQIVKVLLATGQVNFDTQDCFGGTLW
jgi:ankyrin repeat protein